MKNIPRKLFLWIIFRRKGLYGRWRLQVIRSCIHCMSTGSYFDSWRRIISWQDRYLSLQITHPAQERLGTPRGQRPLLLLVPDKWRCCEMGPTGFRPYILEVSRKSNRLQMSLQRQHLLLSNLKSLSVFAVGIWTRNHQLSRPAPNFSPNFILL